MILSFSKQRFVDAIKNGTKIHTIREDKGNRWHAGRKIHFWYGNPRNVSKHPYCFGEGMCTKTRMIKIENKHGLTIELEGYGVLDRDEKLKLVQDDGLVLSSFIKWFVPKPGDVFIGKVIYWNSF